MDISTPINDDPCVALTPLDCEAKRFDKNGYADIKDLTANTKIALNKFIESLKNIGFNVRVNSGFRSRSYQYHLKEVFQKYKKINSRKQEDCPDTIKKLKQIYNLKGLRSTKLVANPANAPHSTGKCVDLTIFDKNNKEVDRLNFDELAKQCGLERPYPTRDKVHYRSIKN